MRTPGGADDAGPRGEAAAATQEGSDDAKAAETGKRPFPFDRSGRVALRADSLLFSLAQSTDELLQAYQLVYRNYLRAEYIDPHPSEMRYSAYNALPSTATFVAKLRNSVVTTASIVFDSPLGLPMDAIYHDELEELRARTTRACARSRCWRTAAARACARFLRSCSSSN